jgi:serine/threonine-protein kinase
MAFEKLGKYKIVGKIGKGAMGEVFRAHDPVLNREVAIKTISASLSADNDLRKRFHREAQAAARLNHPNIITVFDYGEEAGIIYMAMELLEGADLKDILRQSLLATVEDKLDVMEQVADGLAFAHGRDIIHRDLKPGNIHIQPNGQVKILDFGLARLGTSADMTRTGVVMGTPNYMAPEQVKGEKADSRADVFSTGACFYEILTNRKPFDADSAHAVLFQVVHQNPKPMREWSPEVPPILVQLVERAMHKDREQRFRNGAELREALRLVRGAMTAGRTQSATLESEAARAQPEAKPRDQFRSTSKTQPMPTLKPTPGPPGSAAAVAPAARLAHETRAAPRAEMFTETRQPHSPPTIVTAPSRAPLILGGAALLLAAGIGAFVVLRPQQQQPANQGASSDAAVAMLSEALVTTQVELAKRDMEDKNYKSAMVNAERALKLAPGNADAKRVMEQAKGQVDAIEGAASEARQSLESGDTQRATEALSTLLALDPRHPAAAELSSRLDKFFQSQAEDAKRSMGDSRSQAEKTKAASSEGFTQAAGLARDAEALLVHGEFASATRGFLEARDAFDRSRRAAEAKPLPSPPPSRAAAPSAAATAVPSAAPAVTAPAATLPGVIAPPAAEAPKPLAPPRPFAAGQTAIEAAKKPGKAPAGFDTEDVLADRDFLCKLAFEPNPAQVRAGDSYSIKVFMLNDSPKTIKMKSIGLSATVNGGKSAKPALSPKEAPAKGKTLIGELAGTWEEGVNSWVLEATVSSPKDDICRNRLTLK